jgi:hypothetical protein
MLILIIIVVVAILAWFVYDSNRQRIKGIKEDGIKNKYSLLVHYIMSEDSSVRIIRQTSTSIDFSLSNAGGANVFFLTQTFGNLTILWKMHSAIFGEHELEWDFPENLDQKSIIARVDNDLKKYQSNVMSAKGFPSVDDFFQ